MKKIYLTPISEELETVFSLDVLTPNSPLGDQEQNDDDDDDDDWADEQFVREREMEEDQHSSWGALW